jgi:hypothetical protein
MPRGQTKFERCVRGVSRSGSAADPRAVCGAMRAKGTLPRQTNASPAVEQAYRKAERADDKFQAALERKYGSAAGDMRYRTRELPPAIRRLAMAKQRADAAYHKAVDRQRGNPSSDALNRQASDVKARLHEEQERYDRKPTRAGLQRVQSLRGKYMKLSRKYMAAVRKGNPGRRGNPLQGAEKRYESFHGRGSEEIVEVSTPIHEHSVLSGIGDLVKLIVVTERGHKVVISKLEDRNGNPALLAQNEAATQLYIEGGDQSVRLSDFGVYEPYHESETLGRVQNVYYFTRKDHLGSEGGTAIYNHKFGGMREVVVRGKTKRKRSPLPFLVYDVRNKLLGFSGGGYTIPDEGIAN